MKNEKKTTSKNDQQTAGKTRQRSAAGTLISATSGAGAASKKARVTSGDGLANEGTTTAYEDQNRNDSKKI